MRKILCAALGGAVLVSALGLTACEKKGTDRCRYTIAAEYTEETKTLAAEMTCDVVNTSSVALPALKFQLWANAFRKGAKTSPVSELFRRAAYYAGESFGETEVKGITGAESFSVGGEDENILTLSLASPLRPGDSAKVTIAFEVELANVNHRLGAAQNAVNLGGFYPALCYLAEDGFKEYASSPHGDPFVSAPADYDVTLTLPSSYVLASGFAAEESEQEGKRAYHVRAKGVRDVAFCFSKNFEVAEGKAGDVPVKYYYLWDTAPEKTVELIEKCLLFYGESFGDYAYPSYTVAETDLVFGGMEYPAFSMVSTSLQDAEVPAVVAHETAHQWWYSMVGSNQYECAWQDEGLAEYSSALFFGAHPEYGATYREFVAASESAYRAFFSVYSQVHGEANTVMNRPLHAFSGDYEYRSVAYDKGVILFDRVRDVVGEKKLLSALRRYKSAYEGKLASPAGLVSCFTRSGANVKGLFDSFLEGKCVI